MGFILDVDLETSNGSSQEVYARIESIVVNRVTGKIRYQITYWFDQDHAIESSKTYSDEDERKYIGLLQNRIIYYTADSELEILLPHNVEEDLAEEKEIEVPVFENTEVAKEVPYVSFDEEGNEVTLYRTVITVEQKKVGTRLETRKVINPALANDIYKLGYTAVRKVLERYFPTDKILDR